MAEAVNPEGAFSLASEHAEPDLASFSDHIRRFYPSEQLFAHNHADRLYALRRRTPKGRLVTVIGGTHDTDPNFWQYAPGREYFHQWRQQTEGQDRIMLYEGPYSGFADTEEQSIMEYYSERGLVALWSNRYNIRLESAEPENFSDVYMLLNEFPFEEALSFLGAREIPVWMRKPENVRPPLEPYLDRALQNIHRILCATYPAVAAMEYDFSYNNFERIFRPYLGRLMKKTDVSLSGADESEMCLLLSSAYGYPQIASLPVARVGVRVMVLRDTNVASVFDKHRRAGRHIFGWYGQTHVLALKDYLKSFGKPADDMAAITDYLARPSL